MEPARGRGLPELREEVVLTNWTGGPPGNYGGMPPGNYGRPAQPSWHGHETVPAPLPWSPTAHGAPPPTAQPFGAQPFGAPPRKNRKPLIISLVLATIVAVAVAVVIVVNVTRGSHGTAGDAVKGYLQALAAGDAKAALSYSTDQPASTDFLTDEVLKQQIDKWPITDIRILDDSSTHGGVGFAQVHVTAKFGTQTSDVTMSVTSRNSGWKIDHSAIKIDTEGTGVSDNKAMQTLTIFGEPAKGTVYVFPGWIDFGSTNSNLSVTSKPMLLDQLATYSGSALYSDVKVELGEDGRRAVLAGVSNALGRCQKSSSLSPPGCPIRVIDSSLVEGTAVWGSPDISDVKVDVFDEYKMAAMFSGEVRVPLTAQVRTGGTKTGTTTAYLSGTADVTQSPPEVSFR